MMDRSKQARIKERGGRTEKRLQKDAVKGESKESMRAHRPSPPPL